MKEWCKWKQAMTRDEIIIVCVSTSETQTEWVPTEHGWKWRMKTLAAGKG